ncbi:hypothetical protein F511_36866 [Dorcoceras hygrometricum]|uniref:Uncharacterized protein n=1 Tax=Dorcoceras hygrometricum TaxID=472368 RepID=A0A2Z7B9M0_9LAMI|nr:hypothetical protein F511_36866 [Dorcoceras hygrometricum]
MMKPRLIGGRSNPVVDLIRRNLPPPTVKCQFPRETGRSQEPRLQQVDWTVKMRIRPPELETSICDVKYHVSLRRPTSLLPSAAARRPFPPPTAAAPPLRDRTCFDHHGEEIPFVSNSPVFLVQADEGFVFPIVDLIRRSTTAYLLKCRFPCETGRSQAPRCQQGNNR